MKICFIFSLPGNIEANQWIPRHILVKLLDHKEKKSVGIHAQRPSNFKGNGIRSSSEFWKLILHFSGENGLT